MLSFDCVSIIVFRDVIYIKKMSTKTGNVIPSIALMAVNLQNS